MLRLIRAYGDALGPRPLRILTLMAEREEADPGCDEAELVRERGQAFLDLDPVASHAVDALLLACGVSGGGAERGIERYRINATGRAILARRRRKRKAVFGVVQM